MKDLIEGCDLAAQVADTISAQQWQILAATADDTAKTQARMADTSIADFST